jgi:hypothetical protein
MLQFRELVQHFERYNDAIIGKESRGYGRRKELRSSEGEKRFDEQNNCN